jgi:polyferredoxin
MKLNDKAYDILKWIALIVIPALATAYVGLASVWNWPYATQVAETATVVCTLLGALLGISTAQYNKDGSE